MRDSEDAKMIAQILLAHPETDPNVPNKDSGWTSLRAAVSLGNPSMVTILLAN